MAARQQPDKKIVFTRPDGGVSIIYPCISVEDPPGMTFEQALARARLNLPADAINPTEVTSAQVPVDTTFRNAWKHSVNGLEVDMPKARDLWRDKMREARAPLLTDLDVQYIRADEANDTAKKKQIADQKTALRDVTASPAIDAASTPEALKLVWPVILNKA
jgi:hypothetical protein